MKKVCYSVLAGFLVFSLAGCCDTYHGYGRYTLKVDCDKVEIDGNIYKITRRGSEIVIDNHTIGRGIYRKTRPWLYLHHIEGNKVDITFDSGDKAIYPIYIGSTASIFDVYAHPWEMRRSTNAAFPDNKWLISHRWSATGVFFDLQQMLSDETRWDLVKGDIFVPGDGSEVTIAEINTKVQIQSFDAAQKKAMVKFTAL